MQSPEEIADSIVRGSLGGSFTERLNNPNWLPEAIAAALQSYGDARAMAERERCIKAVERVIDWYEYERLSGKEILDAIRALDT